MQGPRLQAEVDRLTAAGWGIKGETADPGTGRLSRGRRRLELLKHKSLHASRSWEPAEWLHERRALDEVRTAWRELPAAEHLAGRQRRRHGQGTPRPPLTEARGTFGTESPSSQLRV